MRQSSWRRGQGGLRCFAPRWGVRGVKSHLKEVGESGQALSSPSVKFILSSLGPECKKGSQRGLAAPRFQDRPETMGGKKSPAPWKDLFLHSVINRGSQNLSASKQGTRSLFPFCNLFLICVAASCFLQATLIGNSFVHTESSSLLSEDTYRGWNQALHKNS